MTSFPDLTLREKKFLQKLLLKKYREQEGKFLIEGPHLVEDALDSSWIVDFILLTPAFLKNSHAQNILKSARTKKIRVVQTTESFFKKIVDTVTSQEIVAVVRENRYSPKEFWQRNVHDSFIVALDAVTDPGNLGTIIRAGDWFNMNGILLGRGTVDLYNPKTLRSAMGSVFHLPVIADVDLEAEIVLAKKSGFTVLAAVAAEGKTPDKKVLSQKSIVIFGNEAHGIHASLLKMADIQITIPRFGKAESLNVGISAGIIMGWMRF